MLLRKQKKVLLLININLSETNFCMKGIDMVYTYELMICSAIAEYMCDLCVEFVG